MSILNYRPDGTLSTTYKSSAGDNFTTIARKVYGDEAQAAHIKSANPGLTEPFQAGVTLTTPPQPGAPQNAVQHTAAAQPNEVAVLINGQRFRFWESVRLVRNIDTFDTLELSAPFEPDNEVFKAAFKPFAFQRVEVTVGGVPLFTGTMVGVTPHLENTRRSVTASCYALPGVLNDCTVPASLFEKLDFKDAGLNEIATTLVKPFGLNVVFQAEQGAVFEHVTLEQDQKVFGFLATLAKQRNLVISSTPQGELLFWRSTSTGQAVARLQEGLSPLLSIQPAFSPQEYYSHVTGIEPVIIGGLGSQYTVSNPSLQGVIRPLTFVVPDTRDTSVKTAVESKAGRMFANQVSYTVNVSAWRDQHGQLWTPNTFIKLNAPGAMVYHDYDFIIRSVEFNRHAKAESATLNLVLPGAFEGQIPEVLPWQD